MHRRSRILAAAALCMLSLLAGGSAASGATSEASRFPLTFENCGDQVTISKPPERVVIIYRDAIPILEAIGALDKVVAKAGGAFPPELYSPETRAVLDGIPTIGGAESADGEVEVSLEEVLAYDPDLVVNYAPDAAAVTRAALAPSGVPLVATYLADCPNPPPLYRDASFDAVYDQVELYGRIFDRQDEAAAVVARLKERVAAVEADAAAQGGAPRTAAALFVPVGGGQLYAYGLRSMVHAQMEAAGLTNVFGDVDLRPIEVTLEEVLARDPDVLVILTIADLQAAKDAFLSLPGVDDLTAVRNDDLFVMKFDYTDPPTPLSVEGLEKVAQAFGSSP